MLCIFHALVDNLLKKCAHLIEHLCSFSLNYKVKSLIFTESLEKHCDCGSSSELALLIKIC